ncbi:E3 ubiquitin-protein ligase PPP1R11-like [Arctopsyche grandis]|uniref:E3 ubiquitin-protein ligase PPP1R11-like n=1 Tax=Arctopsyche grandis TaxID=121162 RepID=UPI00406D8426
MSNTAVAATSCAPDEESETGAGAGSAAQQDTQPSTIAVLTLRKPRVAKKVEWSNDTVDNENMNKKKSKCCCIYKKKKEFGESDSEDSGDECDNCFGHVERRKKQPKPPGSPDNQDPT